MRHHSGPSPYAREGPLLCHRLHTMPELRCSTPGCPEKYDAPGSLASVEYRAGLHGWGIAGIVRLCTAHSGRKKIRTPELTHLPDQLPLWGEEETPAPVQRRRPPRKMQAKDHHA